jgi:putative ABC transport system ATP-binding protein
VTAPVIEVTGVSKDYHGLRPLRIHELRVHEQERVAIVGLDRPMAEVFVNLATGAALPDSGEVKVFGRATSAIGDSAEWLALVDRFGIVSERAVLLDSLSVLQNLALPFTLEIEPPPDEVAAKAESLAREVGLPESEWTAPVAALGATGRVRVRLARALALDPSVVLLEHATAAVESTDAAGLGHLLRSVAVRRGAALVAITADQVFAAAVAGRVLMLDAATGRLTTRRRRWFGFEGRA